MDVFTKFGGGSVKVHAIATVAQGSPSSANNGDSYRRVHTLAHEPDGRCGGTVPSRSTSMSPGQGPAFFDSHIPSSSDPERLEHSPGARLLYWPCCGILGRVITPLKGALGLLLPLLRGCVRTKQWTRRQLIFIKVIGASNSHHFMIYYSFQCSILSATPADDGGRPNVALYHTWAQRSMDATMSTR